MISRVVCVVCLVQWGCALGGYEDPDGEEEAADLYKYGAEERLPHVFWTTSREDYPSLTRMPRHHNGSGARSTLSPEDLLEVKGALKQLLSGRDIDSLMEPEAGKNSKDLTPETEHATTQIKYVARLYRTPRNDSFVKLDSTTLATVEDFDKLFRAKEEYAVNILTPTRSAKQISSRLVVENKEKTFVFALQTMGDYYYQEMLRTGGDKDNTNKDAPSTTRTAATSIATTPIATTPTATTPTATTPTATTPTTTTFTATTPTSTTPTATTSTDTTPTTTTITTTEATTITSSTTKARYLDIEALLNIISNLTYDYETNLTRWVNETLQKWSIPTCPTPVTTTTTTTQITTFGYDYDANGTGVVVAKCYVCGLEVEEIPRRAHCADAFAGDFLPLVPVDPIARGQIGLYRKYCRYMDVPQYHYNLSDTRSIWGRWTGGCSVRWIDLSGVYTQRSCRNRFKPVLGRHFVSKRMAKLEMALQWVDNGCIISPAASLVPLSRGISLYARFHACVCTGSWCNRTPPVQPALKMLALVLAAGLLS